MQFHHQRGDRLSTPQPLPAIPDLPDVSIENIDHHFSVLSKIGNLGPNPKDGFTRAAWSIEETQAMEYIAEVGAQLGLYTRYDALGNLFLRTQWDRDEVVQVGSHLDTVPAGGNYDGAAGVVAGLEAIRAIVAGKVSLARDLELVVWRGEESGSYSVYAGSESAFGMSAPAILEKTYRGSTLAEAIEDQGYDPSFIRNGKPTIDQQQVDRIAAHFELHIEQGTVLERQGLDIGIVTSIRGPIRYTVNLKAQDDTALAHIVSHLNYYTRSLNESGVDLVETVGVLNVGCAPEDSPLKRCSVSAVPGYTELFVMTDAKQEIIKKTVSKIAAERGVQVELQSIDGGYKLIMHGVFDHSGATPMGPEYRKNTNLTAALVVEGLQPIIEAKYFFNYTESPGESTFRLDIRGNHGASRDEAAEKMIRSIYRFAGYYGAEVSHTLDKKVAPTEQMSLKIQDLLERVCRLQGLRSIRMSSGAGHDVAVVSKQQKADGGSISTGLVFIPCRNGISHDKAESASHEAIRKGAQLLRDTLLFSAVE